MAPLSIRLSNTVKWIWPTNRSGRLLLIFPVLSAAFYVAVSLLYLNDGTPMGYDSDSLLFDLYNLLPSLALAALSALTSRRMARGMPVVAFGSLVFTGATVFLLLGIITDESSTAVLALLFIPLILGALVIVIGLFALLQHVLSNRRAHQARQLSQ